MEDQDCQPSAGKRCHWHPEAAGQRVLEVLMPPLDEALPRCGRAAPSATSWLLQPGRNRSGKLRHGVVVMDWPHLIPRDEQVHPTEAGNTHPLIPWGSRIVSVTHRMHPGSHCIPTRLHPTLLHPTGSSSGCGG